MKYNDKGINGKVICGRNEQLHCAECIVAIVKTGSKSILKEKQTNA